MVKDPLLKARVAVDLMHLSYYLVRREATSSAIAPLAERSRRRRSADPGRAPPRDRRSSTPRSNEVRQSADRVRGAPKTPSSPAPRRGEPRPRRDARAAAARAPAVAFGRLRRRPCRGGPHREARGPPRRHSGERVGRLHRRLRGLGRGTARRRRSSSSRRPRPSFGSTARRSGDTRCLCLARARLERGEIDRGRTARAAKRRPVRRRTGGTWRCCAVRPRSRTASSRDRRTGFPEDEQFRNNVRAIAGRRRATRAAGVRMLDEAAKEYEARGMAHWALGAAVHAAYWRESLVRGGGASRARARARHRRARRRRVRVLPAGSRRWLGRVGRARSRRARASRKKNRAHAEAALRRAKSDAGAARRRRRSTRRPSASVRSASPGASSGFSARWSCSRAMVSASIAARSPNAWAFHRTRCASISRAYARSSTSWTSVEMKSCSRPRCRAAG